MGDIDFEKSLVTTPINSSTAGTKKVKRVSTTKQDRSNIFSLSSALSPFQQELETRWKAGLAKRRELEMQGSMGSQVSAHQPLTRFAPFSVSDAPRPPPLNQADSLALLVDDVVPKALHTLLNSRTTRAQKNEAKALCLPGTRGHTSLLWAACWVAFGAAFAKTVLSAVSPAIIKDFGISKSVYGALSGLPAIRWVVREGGKEGGGGFIFVCVVVLCLPLCVLSSLSLPHCIHSPLTPRPLTLPPPLPPFPFSNILAGPLGGALIDRMGADKGCVLFALVVVAGSVCATLSLPTEVCLFVCMVSLSFLSSLPPSFLSTLVWFAACPLPCLLLLSPSLHTHTHPPSHPSFPPSLLPAQKQSVALLASSQIIMGGNTGTLHTPTHPPLRPSLPPSFPLL